MAGNRTTRRYERGKKTRQATQDASPAGNSGDDPPIHDLSIPLGNAPIPGNGTEPRTAATEIANRQAVGIRPTRLSDFTGQDGLRANLAVFIGSARARGQPLDHVVLVGPPGLGKTTLARVVAHEMGAPFHSTSGPVIAKAGDLAALLTALEPGDVLFIDEIHRVAPAVAEILYPAMEDGHLDLMIGEGPGARSVKVDVAPFTLIGATTRMGLLTPPLRDRFGIPLRLSLYGVEDLTRIVMRAAALQGIAMDEDGATAIAKRSRGTPRIAGRLLRRARDFADMAGAARIDVASVETAMAALGVDPMGLDRMDGTYLRLIAEAFGGGPVGIETIASALGEPADALIDIVEPHLIQNGLVQRTPRGRALTEAGRLKAREVAENRDAAVLGVGSEKASGGGAD